MTTQEIRQIIGRLFDGYQDNGDRSYEYAIEDFQCFCKSGSNGSDVVLKLEESLGKIKWVTDILTPDTDATTYHQTIFKINGKYYGLDWWTNSYDGADFVPSQIYKVSPKTKVITYYEQEYDD